MSEGEKEESRDGVGGAEPSAVLVRAYEGPCQHEGPRPYVLKNYWAHGVDRWPVCLSCGRDFEIAIRRFELKTLNLTATESTGDSAAKRLESTP